MTSYVEEPEAAAYKWVSIREENREKFDLPTVFSILIYTHPETGFPLAICDEVHRPRVGVLNNPDAWGYHSRNLLLRTAVGDYQRR